MKKIKLMISMIAISILGLATSAFAPANETEAATVGTSELIIYSAGATLPSPVALSIDYEFGTDPQTITQDGQSSYAVQSGMGELVNIAVDGQNHSVPAGGGASPSLFVGHGIIWFAGGGYARYDVMIIAGYVVVIMDVFPCC